MCVCTCVCTHVFICTYMHTLVMLYIWKYSSSFNHMYGCSLYKYDSCEILCYCWGGWSLCSFGAALTVETLDSYETMERLQYNPLCFLLYQDLQQAPDQWTDVSPDTAWRSKNLTQVEWRMSTGWQIDGWWLLLTWIEWLRMNWRAQNHSGLSQNWELRGRFLFEETQHI